MFHQSYILLLLISFFLKLVLDLLFDTPKLNGISHTSRLGNISHNLRKQLEKEIYEVIKTLFG